MKKDTPRYKVQDRDNGYVVVYDMTVPPPNDIVFEAKTVKEAEAWVKKHAAK